jgi:hypothetical protein
MAARQAASVWPREIGKNPAQLSRRQSPLKTELVKVHGADYAINYREQILDEALKITNGWGVDAAPRPSRRRCSSCNHFAAWHLKGGSCQAG